MRTPVLYLNNLPILLRNSLSLSLRLDKSWTTDNSLDNNLTAILISDNRSLIINGISTWRILEVRYTP